MTWFVYIYILYNYTTRNQLRLNYLTQQMTVHLGPHACYAAAVTINLSIRVSLFYRLIYYILYYMYIRPSLATFNQHKSKPIITTIILILPMSVVSITILSSLSVAVVIILYLCISVGNMKKKKLK